MRLHNNIITFHQGQPPKTAWISCLYVDVKFLYQVLTKLKNMPRQACLCQTVMVYQACRNSASWIYDSTASSTDLKCYTSFEIYNAEQLNSRDRILTNVELSRISKNFVYLTPSVYSIYLDPDFTTIDYTYYPNTDHLWQNITFSVLYAFLNLRIRALKYPLKFTNSCYYIFKLHKELIILLFIS